MRTLTVSANGIRFVCLEEAPHSGGPLVILCHGFPDTPHTWRHVMPLLAARGYRAVAPFMRGYQPTAIPEQDTTDEMLARDVLGLIETLGETSAILIGHDWGASAVYGATSMDPSRVSKLIAIGIPHPATLKPTLRKLWGVRHFMLFKVPGAARRFAANDFAALPEVCNRWSPAWHPTREELAEVRECFSDPVSLNAAMGYYRALTFTARPHLRTRIAVPTVVFSGTGDPNADLDDYERGRKMFTGEYVIERVPGGHFMHLEHPEEFAAKLLLHMPSKTP